MGGRARCGSAGRRVSAAGLVGVTRCEGVAGVEVGLLAGTGERDVGPFAGGVLRDDQVCGVGRLALGGERVLHVCETYRGLAHLAIAIEHDLQLRRQSVTHTPTEEASTALTL
jgi:hypothetical protein